MSGLRAGENKAREPALQQKQVWSEEGKKGKPACKDVAVEAKRRAAPAYSRYQKDWPGPGWEGKERN